VNRNVVFLMIMCILAVAAGCGGEKKQSEAQQTGGTETQTVGRGGAEDSVVTSPGQRRWPSFHGAVLDSMRAQKKRFHITQDQYWEDKGGVLANEFFEVWYPAGRVTVTQGMYVFQELMPARKTFEEFFGTAPRELLVVRCSPDLDTYKAMTGRDWWYYSAIKGDSLTFAPLFIISRRGISDVALPHEYYQWAIRKITRDGVPRWLEEGIASYLAGEGDLLLNQMYEFKDSDVSMTPEKIEMVLQSEEDRRESRIAYFRSYRMVKQLIGTYGEKPFKQAVLAIGEGSSLDQACMKAFHKEYNAVLQDATQYTVDLSQKK
jgi:hypothetical protein